MKWLVANRKVSIIVLFVLLSGLLLQLSRSQFVLEMVDNENLVAKKDEIISASLENPTETSYDVDYCIVYDETTLSFKNNAEQALQYMHKKTKSYDVYLGKVDYNRCPRIILTTPYLKHLGSIEEIENYVYHGGRLFLMNVLEMDTHFQVLYRKLGIVDFHDYVETNGVKMLSNVLIGTKGKTFLENTATNVSIGVTLNNHEDTLMQTSSGVPLLWKSSYGEGTFVVFNGTILTSKTSRGVFSGAISLMEPDYIYPIFNSKTFYIDDFPAPIAKGTNDVIYKEYKRDLPTFYQNIWWPDMLQLANEFNITYTGMLIESYNNLAEAPFENTDDAESSYLISFGRELIQSGGELGFHGYNHQSFTMDKEISKSFGYNAWKSTEDMKLAIQELRRYTKTGFPAYKVTSYVPPSNVLSQEGRKLLKEVWPELTVIASLYSEDITTRSYVQEFEIAEDGVIEMPRISSGYFKTETNEWAIANAITGLGVFSHFIHPDDVISEDRSKGSWSDMYEEFEELMKEIHKTYPWFRSMTATDAALDVAKVLQSTVNFKQTENKVHGTIENFYTDQYFVFRTEKQIGRLQNCTVQKIDTNTYLVTAEEAEFEIALRGNK
ncbi:DUF2194 domain-containing protein [Lysinibacillus sp. KU-BSD001]|uniref:DUF2194 domain-containing protein n=1 Tax=Lysinibacillus sp. KU-BSD001 TaxID=3141328 RepID=UPI0036E25B67